MKRKWKMEYVTHQKDDGSWILTYQLGTPFNFTKVFATLEEMQAFIETFRKSEREKLKNT